MDEETAILHLEHRHDHQLGKLVFSAEPDRKAAGQSRRLRASRKSWDLFHKAMHGWGKSPDHIHEEDE